MKHHKLFRILALSVVLALLMLTVPATTVLAATESISLDPDEGEVGDDIDIDGYYFDGYTSTEYVYVYFSCDSASVGNEIDDEVEDYEHVATVAIDTSTTYYMISTSFDVPSSLTDGDDTVSVTSGDYYVYVTYYDDPDEIVAVDTFTVVMPEIALSPTSGAVGDTVTITGTGFSASSDITVYFDGDDITSLISGDYDTNSSGYFACTFSVPTVSRGSYTVKVEDEDEHYDTINFTVSASITINPTSGPSSTTVTVTGNGFGASRAVTITYNASTVITNPSSLTTDSTGYFTATFSVPSSAAGSYAVQASDGTNTATAVFTSTTSATISQTTTTTDPGYVGMSLTVTGVGFTPSTTITVSYGSETLATDTTDASGNFSVTFTIPASAAGTHTITVTDGTISESFDFFMESNPPPTPELTLPEADTKLKDNLFEWTAVEDAEDSNPVTYDIQVSADNTFSTASLLVNNTGLTTATYTLLEEEELESTSEDAPYYWRVRAVDAASNTSSWSTPSTFTVGWSFEFTGWVVWVTMAVVAILFFFIGMWLGRRGGGGYY